MGFIGFFVKLMYVLLSFFAATIRGKVYTRAACREHACVVVGLSVIQVDRQRTGCAIGVHGASESPRVLRAFGLPSSACCKAM